MTITIQVADWNHIGDEQALDFVLKEVIKDNKNKQMFEKKGHYCADYYKKNGIEYRVSWSK